MPLIKMIEWREIPLLVPRRYRKEIPIYCVVKEFDLFGGEGCLNARRVFANCQESTRIVYQGSSLNETVDILDGKIIEVYNVLPVREEYRPGMNEGEAVEWMMRVCNPPKPKEKTYHNIKRYGKELRELPSIFQSDLRAVYEGSGIFES